MLQRILISHLHTVCCWWYVALFESPSWHSLIWTILNIKKRPVQSMCSNDTFCNSALHPKIFRFVFGIVSSYRVRAIRGTASFAHIEHIIDSCQKLRIDDPTVFSPFALLYFELFFRRNSSLLCIFLAFLFSFEFCE